MFSTARKIGNSTGFIINARDLKAIGIKQGDDIEYTIESGKLVIQKAVREKQKPYKIDDLIANTDFDALSRDPDLLEWEAMPPAGKEIL
ncbi:hypothetical protein [Glaciecola sp. SC05]|uniref:AbrB/MazE/SpoVT family DNA-binding domain-containing protein n=1 Tax=Glaciecola sp. SC05 TaxID=1987355 RepID=UPI003526FB0E